MDTNTVYIFHKNGAESHYRALDLLLSERGISLKHREFSVLSKLVKSIVSFNGELFRKQLVNIGFIISLILSSDKKVVLGIAPIDPKLKSLLFLLKKQQVYYHTSWTYWDKSFQPKSKKMSQKVLETWRVLIEERVTHIFAVTNQTKNQLLKNYTIGEDKVSVVYHSLKTNFTNPVEKPKKELSFIYLGRLVPQKGLYELLEFFSKHIEATFTLVGDGKEESLVNQYSTKYPNIIYIPFIKDLDKIVELLATKQYLVLNSKRTDKWEELFGMVIIESMAQGVIPITTKHSGPKEIVTKDIGYLCEEGHISTVLNSIIESKTFDEEKSSNAREKAQEYLEEHIASRWSKILD